MQKISTVKTKGKKILKGQLTVMSRLDFETGFNVPQGSSTFVLGSLGIISRTRAHYHASHVPQSDMTDLKKVLGPPGCTISYFVRLTGSGHPDQNSPRP